MNSTLFYSPGLAAYDLGPQHPLRPERVTLAVALMEAYRLVPEGTTGLSARGDARSAAGASPPLPRNTPLGVTPPDPASDDELLLAHAPAYVAAVREAGAHPEGFGPRSGIGTLDTPAFPGMHEAAALVAGATMHAVRDVLDGRCTTAFSVAGGLHHAHRDHASGFCVYNDAAVAIAAALRAHEDLRVAYVDIDAHHGDGVESFFYAEPRVLTISLHETGRVLFPGTGFTRDRGTGAGAGSAANIPLPPLATDACYQLAFEQAVAPLVRGFRPDLIVAQCGADAHHADPLTSLGMTLTGHRWLVTALAELAGELSGGRIVALGGGGYSWEHVVPRAWASVASVLAGVALPDALPETWRDLARRTSGVEPPLTIAQDVLELPPDRERAALDETRAVVARLMTDADG